MIPLAQTVTELPSLVSNLLLLLSDKEKVVIKKRFSLDGLQKHTLDEIGKEFTVTRERIRQIEKNALSKMRRNVFNTALKGLHDFSSQIVKENGGLLRKSKLIDELVSVLPPGFKLDSNSFYLSVVLHEDLNCIGNTINFHPYVRSKDLKDYSLKFLSDRMINQLHKYGNVKKMDRIHRDLKGDFSEVDFDVLRAKSLVDIDKRMTLLDDDSIALMEWRHIHPRTLRDKILFVLKKEKKTMHFSTIAEKISEANFDKRSVNIQAVHNELIRHDQFVLIGRGIYALAEWGYEKGTVSEVIEALLKENGEMGQDGIVDLVLKKRKVKRITILLALKNGKKFERVGRKEYRLK